MEQKGKDNPRLVRDIAESLGKLPPQALDMEEAVLGALMLEKYALADVIGYLRPAHFYSEAHKEIYQAIQNLYQATEPVDMRTVVAQLRKNGKLELAGGAYYVAELTSKMSSAANIEYHARIIQEYHLKREIIVMASNMHQKAYEDTTDVFELIDWINSEMQKAIDANFSGQGEKHIKEFAFKALQDMQGRMAGHSTGVMTGYHSVDQIINGHQPGDLVVIGARPGMGKTGFVFQELVQIAKRGDPVGIFSLEMPGVQLVNRAACAEAELDNDAVAKGKLSEVEFRRYMDALSVLQGLPIYVDDAAMVNNLEIRARARRLKVKFGVRLIAVDFLQMVKAITEQKSTNRDQEIGIISRTLKAIAKELEIPVIAVSSLSRDVEKRGGAKRPQLADLRESGNLESDADVVIFLYRPEYYGFKTDDNDQPTHGQCEVIVAKHRNGSLGTAMLKFIGRFTKFLPWVDATKSPDYSGVKDPGTPDRDITPPDDRNLDLPF